MDIICTGLCRSYGTVMAVNHLNATIRGGVVTGLVGPNGAGKSTLLRLLAGREAPTEGNIVANGISIADYPENFRSIIGFMPDSLPDIRTQSVLNYLDYFARCTGLRGEIRLNRVKEVVAFTQLKELVNRRLNELSKGMKQRVSLARVLLGNPEVLLLDEPAAGLDPRARIELRDDIKKLADKGMTIVISSHILTELEDMCEDVIIMELGRIVAAGKVTELVSKDKNAVFELELSSISNEILEKIRSVAHVKAVTELGRHALSVTLDETGDDVLDSVVAQLFMAHLPVTAFHRKGQSLEEIFMSKTEGIVQ